MAVVKLKKPAEAVVPVAAPATTPNEIAALIEELGGMQLEAAKVAAKIAELGKQLAPYKEKLKQLAALVTEQEGRAPEEEFTQESASFIATVGKRTKVRTVVDKLAILKAMGEDRFIECANFLMKDIDAYLTVEERKKALTVSWGDRSVKIEPRPKQLKTKAA